MGSKPLFIFVHIPKTAGTSVTRGLREIFGIKKVYRPPPRGFRLIREMPLSEFAPYRCVSAHMPMRVLRAKFGDEASYFTVIREPVARVVSFYRHVLRDERHADHEVAKGAGMRGWLAHLQSADESRLSACQNFWIASDISVDAVKRDCRDLVIGDQRNVGGFLTRIALAARKPVPATVPVLNTSSDGYLATPDEIAEIRRLFAADIEAYQWLHENGLVI
jgi:sulfotransferase famil protein